MAGKACSLGMAVGPHPLTADAAIEILRLGGNAFDAAVASAFTEAVVEPAHNGLGGYGGGAVCFRAEGQPGGGGSAGQVFCVDYNTVAPEGADAAWLTGGDLPGGPPLCR